MEEKRSAYDMASETSNTLQVEVDEVCRELTEKTKGKLKSVEKNIKEAVTTMDKCKSEILRLQGAIRTSER